MRRVMLALVFLALPFAACGDGLFCPDDNCSPLLIPTLPPPEIPPPTSAESLVRAIEVIFNDNIRNAVERRQAYQDLFGPGLQCTDSDSCQTCLCTFIDPEAVGNIFRGQENGSIYSLSLVLTIEPAIHLDPPQPGREDWKLVPVPNIHLRLLYNPRKGLEVLDRQATVMVYPSADRGRWFIAEVLSSPRP